MATEPIGKVAFDLYEVLGNSAGRRDVRAALASGAGVLNVVTHSDGIDALLGPGILCPIGNWPPARHNHKTPACVITGRCHRSGQSLEEVRTADFVISPALIRARVLLWQGCFGIRFQDSVVEPVWGLLPHFLANSSLGAVLTSWEVILPRPEISRLFIQFLFCGLSLGEALFATMEYPAAQAVGWRLCLFGDPSLKLPLIDFHDGITQNPTDERPAKPFGWKRSSAQWGFIRTYLTLALEHCSGEVANLAKDALAAAVDLEQRMSAQVPRTQTRDLDRQMRRALLKYFCRRGTVPAHDWMKLAENFSTQGTEHCDTCRQRTRTTVIRLGSGRWIRSLKMCPLCGIIEDKPRDWFSISIKVSDACAVLKGEFPRSHWTASLLVEPPLKERGFGVAWPRNPAGAPIRTFRLPRSIPPGPITLAFGIVWKNDFLICRCIFRNDRCVGI